MWITVLDKPEISKYDVHRLVWSMWKSTERNFCFSIFSDSIKVLSIEKLTEESVKVDIKKGSTISFSMRCCPGRGTYRDENGKRHRMTPRKNIGDVFSWIERRISDSAVLVSASGKMLNPECVERPGGKKMIWSQWLITGMLVIDQPKKFESMACKGLGQGSAFGLGMIDIIEVL